MHICKVSTQHSPGQTKKVMKSSVIFGMWTGTIRIQAYINLSERKNNMCMCELCESRKAIENFHSPSCSILRSRGNVPPDFFRAPQQMLRTHRRLEDYCATLWWRWSVFFFVFPCNGAPVEWNWQGETEVLGERPVPVRLLSTTNPTWTDLGSNRGLRGGRPATNRLSHGTALSWPLMLSL
jgi:hypothetical protein